MAKNKTTHVGEYFTIPAGATVYRAGERITQTRDTIVRVRAQDKTDRGNTRIWWKSNGYKASTTL